jgi:hypothetical protein
VWLPSVLPVGCSPSATECRTVTVGIAPLWARDLGLQAKDVVRWETTWWFFADLVTERPLLWLYEPLTGRLLKKLRTEGGPSDAIGPSGLSVDSVCRPPLAVGSHTATPDWLRILERRAAANQGRTIPSTLTRSQTQLGGITLSLPRDSTQAASSQYSMVLEPWIGMLALRYQSAVPMR